MEGGLRGARSRKNALDFAKGRMLGKDDSFKVILDPATDPGADKHGLLRSGQVLSHREDTGGACSLPTSGDSSRKGAGVGAAQLIQFICTGLVGQTFAEAERRKGSISFFHGHSAPISRTRYCSR